MGRKKLKIIKEDCDPVDAQDKTLPTNAFLVEYRVDDASHYDLVFASKQVRYLITIMIIQKEFCHHEPSRGKN